MVDGCRISTHRCRPAAPHSQNSFALISGGQSLLDKEQRVVNLRAERLGKLHAAGGAGGGDQPAGLTAQTREQLELAHLLREGIVLGFVAERARHATTARVAQLYVVAAYTKQFDSGIR